MVVNQIVKIDEIYCVSLPEKKHLWKKFDDLNLGIQLQEAVDSRSNLKIYENYGLSLDPADEVQAVYFSQSPGAVGCYLSHFEIWWKSLHNGNEWTLALEDDADVDDIKTVLTKIRIPDLCKEKSVPKVIQLNTRTNKSELPFWFNGTEAYLFNRQAAISMLYQTHDMSHLNSCKREYFMPDAMPHYNDEFKHHIEAAAKINLKKDFSKRNCIRYAADKFIGHCSIPSTSNKIRIRIQLMSFVRLKAGNENASTVNSDVTLRGATPHWLMTLEEYKTFKKSPYYEWWNK